MIMMKSKKLMDKIKSIEKIDHEMTEIKNKVRKSNNISHTKRIIGKLFNGYKKCYMKGKQSKQNLCKYLFFKWSFNYIHTYQTYFYKEILNKKSKRGKNSNIIKKELNLYKLINKFKPYSNSGKENLKRNNIKISSSNLQLYSLQDKYNYAHLLFYVGRFIPAIHNCNNLLSTKNQDITRDRRISIFCVTYNLLFYLVFTYLYDTDSITNKYGFYKIIIYGEKFLKFAKKSSLDDINFQVKSISNVIPLLKEFYNKIKSSNKGHNTQKVLFNRTNLFKEWMNKKNLNLSISDDLETDCHMTLSLPHITHDYFKNLEKEYISALYQYFQSIKYHNYSYTYTIYLMKSSFKSLYSLLDKIVLDLTMWTNNTSNNTPLIYMVKKYNDKKQINDFVPNYFDKFLSNKRMNTIFKNFEDNDPLQGLRWIAQSINNKNISDQKLVFCKKLRNALVHQFVFIKLNNKHDMTIHNITDKYKNPNGAIIIDFNTFISLFNYLMHICRESIIMLLCFININGKSSEKFIKDELKKYSI